MKKINSVKQLKAEKKRIEQHREELEKKIGSSWKELKVDMKPVNIAKDAFSRIMKNKTDDNLYGGLLMKSALTFGVTLLAKKLVNRTGFRFGRIFKKDPARDN
ncbi:MAG TPA: hypothetical protein VHL77_01700 [Ferruginibacter sp.]|nr:hypothetical protein [Ferruginibacter sp.]